MKTLEPIYSSVEVNKGTDLSLRERGRVAVMHYDTTEAPESITRLGASKVEYLINGIGQLKKGTKTLELFGGSGLSTSILAKQVGANNLISVDLHNSLSHMAEWRYEPADNFDIQQRRPGGTRPSWVTASADRLPFADDSFEAVVAPDPPRTAAERFEGDRTSSAAGLEVVLDSNEQRDLAYAAASEAYRVLTDGGRFLATLPYSVATRLRQIGYSDVKIFSNVELGNDVTVVPIGRKLVFRTHGAIDPVVYSRCIK